MESGHPEAYSYPLKYLVHISALLGKREMQMYGINANLITMGVAGILDKKAAKHFHDTIRGLNDGETQ